MYSCLTIMKSSNEIEKTLYESSNSSISITKKDGKYFNVNQFKDIEKLKEIEEKIIQYDGLAKLKDAKVVSGEQRINREDLSDEFKNVVSLEATNNTKRNILFSSGVFTIKEGKNIGENDKDSIIVHEEFAKQNNLKLGDEVDLELLDIEKSGKIKSHKFKIIGIFSADCQKKFPDLLMQWLNAEQGKSRALNLALYNSDGKYIINLDSDGILEKNALVNLITRFEQDTDLNCMTGAILTIPEQIQAYKGFFPRLLRNLEFMEYAQAFLAGRSYASEMNAVYTLSGAFSAFRKSVVLKSWMYNTDTICEDTHITFQMKYRQNERVEVCEDAIFFVDPIEDMNKLYTQRQRWQRGSLEVAKMFMDKSFKVKNIFSNVSVKTLLYDHTFAFPRMIWYLALARLTFKVLLDSFKLFL